RSALLAPNERAPGPTGRLKGPPTSLHRTSLLWMLSNEPACTRPQLVCQKPDNGQVSDYASLRSGCCTLSRCEPDSRVTVTRKRDGPAGTVFGSREVEGAEPGSARDGPTSTG